MSKKAERGPIVWVLQEPWSPRIDLTSLNRYGAIKYILKRDVIPSQTFGPSTTRMRHVFEKEFDPSKDYIASIYSGDPGAALLAGAVLMDSGLLRGEGVQWMRWERERYPKNDEGVRMRPEGAPAGFYVPSPVKVV